VEGSEGENRTTTMLTGAGCSGRVRLELFLPGEEGSRWTRSLKGSWRVNKNIFIIVKDAQKKI